MCVYVHILNRTQALIDLYLGMRGRSLQTAQVCQFMYVKLAICVRLWHLVALWIIIMAESGFLSSVGLWLGLASARGKASK